MKLLKFSLLLCSMMIMFSSCKNEFECTSSNVAGTYTGVNDCDPMDIQDLTLTVSAFGNDVTITGDDGTTWTTSLTDCQTETETTTIEFLGIEIMTEIDVRFTETELVYDIQVTTAGIADKCNITLIKQ